MRKGKTMRRDERGPINWTISEEEKEKANAHNQWIQARRNNEKTKRHKAR